MHKTCVILKEGEVKLWVIFPVLCLYGNRPLHCPVCFCLQCLPTRPDPDVVTQQIFTANLESVPEHTVHHRLWTPAELAPASLTKTLRATTDSASRNSRLNWDSVIKRIFVCESALLPGWGTAAHMG